MISTHPDDTINNLSDLFALFEKRWTVDGPAIFRGEPATFPQNLTPSLFREGLPDNEFAEYENAFVNRNSSGDQDYMFERLFPTAQPESLPAVALLQHYGSNTRLLDVTFNPLIALFFATRTHLDDDGFVFTYFGNYLDIVDNTRERSLHTLISSETIGDYHPGPDTLLLYRPEWPNIRSAAQNGAFIFTKGFHQYLWGGGAALRVPAHRKDEIQIQLRRFGISDHQLFPQIAAPAG